VLRVVTNCWLVCKQRRREGPDRRTDSHEVQRKHAKCHPTLFIAIAAAGTLKMHDKKMQDEKQWEKEMRETSYVK